MNAYTVNLRAERFRRGLTIRQAAASIGISASALQRAEQGQDVSVGTAHKIAQFYGADPAIFARAA